MIDSHQEVEKLPGTVFVDGEKLGECRYEFVYNPFDTNSMDITLLGPPNGMPHGPDMPPTKVVTEFSWGSYEMDLNRELAGGWRMNMKESRYKAPVEEFRKVQRFDEEADAKKVGIRFLFPLTSVTESSTLVTSSPSHGYVRAKYDREEEVFDPRDNSFSVETPIGEVEIGDEFDFQDEDHELYPATLLTRRSRLVLNREIDEETVEEVIESTRNVAYNIFHMLSLIERTRINWHTERVFTKSEEGYPILKKTRYRWRPTPSSSYRPDRNALPERRKTLEKLLDAYWDCDEVRQTDIDSIIDNFKTANSGDTIQSKFIHWHSCLDFFKPLFFGDLPEPERKRIENNMSFSMQLVRLFDEAGIEIEDLLPEDTIRQIKSRKLCNWRSARIRG